MSSQIFSDIRILDFTQLISGSYATAIMADMGAEVIKVEPPVRGDSLRLAGPKYNGESAFFLLKNRNKKSLSVNLKTPGGIDLVKQLVPHCTIVAENFTPGVMDKMGLGYKDLSAIKADIIYTSVSGYGHNNSNSNRPAYDIIIQSETGLAAQNGMPDRDTPLRSPLSISDYAVAIYGAFAMSAAVFHHKNTGRGQNIDLSMYDALISIMDNTFLICDQKGEEIKKQGEEKELLLKELGLRSSGNRHPETAPHGHYRTKDGFVAHMSLTSEMWHKLLKIIKRQDLIGNPAYEELENRKARWHEIDQIIEEWTTQHTTEEVVKIFNQNRLPCGRTRTVDQVYEDPHNTEREIFQEVMHSVAGKLRITSLPIKFSGTPAQVKTPSPLLGEHNYEVLSSILGYSQAEVDELLEKKVLYQK